LRTPTIRLIWDLLLSCFTLAEIQEWIRDFESEQLTIEEKQIILGRKLEQIDKRIEELKTMQTYLVTKIEGLQR
jgi:MerR family transcriptional regulator, copper efflux regulator